MAQFEPVKLAQVLQKIGELSDRRGCPICGCETWNLTSDQAFYVPSNPPNIIGAGSAHIPLLALECSECKHQMFFNAIALGLVERT